MYNRDDEKFYIMGAINILTLLTHIDYDGPKQIDQCDMSALTPMLYLAIGNLNDAMSCEKRILTSTLKHQPPQIDYSVKPTEKFYR